MRLLVAFAFIPLTALAEVPGDSQIVLLGEVHDNADAHIGQAEIIARIQPTAVLFEMLSPEQGRQVDADRSLAAEVWAENPWPDYNLYAPIFDALGDARIVGMAVPRTTNRTVFVDGPAQPFGPESGRFGLETDLPPDQLNARRQLQFAAHCEAMPMEMMDGMVNVQRYWDASFARAALKALEDHGPPVAVILGNGHVRTDWGVPALLRAAAPDVATYAIGFVESDNGLPMDEINLVPPAEREDPCAEFEKG